jgi:hypothetical protein
LEKQQLIPQKDFKKILLEELNDRRLKGKKFQELRSLIADDKNLGDDHPTNPRTPSLDGISSTGEGAFQRAIFSGGWSILRFHNQERMIQWLDLELPVMLSTSARRKSVDLIGNIDNHPTLCELKFMERSAGDEPKYAVFELVIYYYFVLCNCTKLDAGKVHHKLDDQSGFEWKDVVRDYPLLLVAANKKYWEFWLGKKYYREDLLNLIKNLNAKLQIDVCAFQLEDVDFKLQKGKKDVYKPTIRSKHWQQI